MKGFPNKKNSKFKFLDKLCAVSDFENVNEDITLNYGYECELSFQHMTDTDISDAARKQNEEGSCGED